MWKSYNIQVLRFIVAGGLSTLSHWLVMAIMIFAAIMPEIASAAGALFGAVVNYILQKTFAFQSVQRHRITLPRYVAVCILLWLANLLIFSTMIRLLSVQIIIAQIITTALVAILSYWLFKRNVFNDYKLSPAS